ncbi:shufflon system plasmid conjugative transfer pilus tip adhesin PilV [Salmonella enterica]|uniref:shufflon system plasmid conjugative transfer pilus tip adhesin PilV n=1 Tax=Salmonella enterica TaxID=28901 RepID=UPI003A5C4858
MWFERPNPELLQAMVVSSGGTPYPVKALIQMAKDITAGLGGYIQDGKQPQVHYVPGQ